jgi:hypothetical protein
MMVIEHLDLRYVPAPESRSSDLQTIGSLLASKSPPEDEREQEFGEGRLGAHGGNVLIWDCTVDADIPVALDDAAVVLVASDVRGFGHVSWAEIAVRRAALGGTRTALLSMFGGPLVVTGTATERPTKADDEDAGIRAVAEALNRRPGPRYRAERLPKNRNHEPWEDGMLRPEDPRAPTIPVQVRHFSDDLARLMRGQQRSALKHYVGILSKVLQSAIDDKTRVDPDERRKAHLVLISPVALGEIKRSEIASFKFESGGYANVWLCPAGEPAFSLLAG